MRCREDAAPMARKRREAVVIARDREREREREEEGRRRSRTWGVTGITKHHGQRGVRNVVFWLAES
jgi:hypothetical protein